MSYNLEVTIVEGGYEYDEVVDKAAGKHSWASGMDMHTGARDLVYEFDNAADGGEAMVNVGDVLRKCGVKHKISLEPESAVR